MIPDFLYKTLIGVKTLRIIFNKVDGFIRDYGETNYLVLLGSEIYNTISNRIRCLARSKSGILYVVSHNYAKTKINSDDNLPLEKNIDHE